MACGCLIRINNAPPGYRYLCFMSRRRKLSEQQVYAGLMSREYLRFAECGLSNRVIGALIKAAIDAPERLLSMAPDRIVLIQGIGPGLMKEIERYRARATSTASQKARAG
jgi:hypothetical protein